MRVLVQFTIPQLAMTADLKPDNARNYVRRLQQEGFVRKTQPHQNGQAGSYALWRLMRNSGPQAPIPLKGGGVYDPNTHRTYGGHRDLALQA